jgi:excisionase family DNA binding protein
MIKSNKKAITDLGRVKAGRTEPTIYAQWIGAKLDKIESLLIELRATASKPLDLGGGAAYLHISKSHLYQLTSKGLIAHFKPAGKKIYFQKEDLDAYLLRNRRAAANEIDEAAASHIVNHPAAEVALG